MTAGPARARQRGVTLVELVVVLTIMGVVVSLGATLIGRTVAAQQAQHGRLTLAAAADGALARVADELQGALPNSLRVAAAGGSVWIEWVPVLDAGRYRTAPDTVSGTPGDSLDLDDAGDGGFDVIGTPIASAAAAAGQLVLHNLGTPEADAYTGGNRRGGLVLGNGGRHVAFTPAGALPAGSGAQRFFIVGTPVTLACEAVAGGGYALRRHGGYGWQAGQPTSAAALAGGSAALLLGGLSACSAAYSSALANIGLLNLRLTLAGDGGGGGGGGGGGAQMTLLQQLAVDNTP